MEIKRYKGKIQLRRTVYVPVQHFILDDNGNQIPINKDDAQEGQQLFQVPGTGRGRMFMIGSFDAYDIPASVDAVKLKDKAKDGTIIEPFTDEERAQLQAWIDAEKAKADAQSIKTAGFFSVDYLEKVAADPEGAGLDQLKFDQILNAIDALKVSAKAMGLKAKTAPVRAKEAEARAKGNK